MNVVDLIIGIPLLWAVYRGFRQGILSQFGGLAGLLAGCWLAFRYGAGLGGWLGFEGPAATVAGIVLILIGSVLVFAIVGRAAKGLVSLAGLGIVDKVGGALLSAVKMIIIVALLLCGFDFLNSQQGWVSGDKLQSSRLYEPVAGSLDYIFPYAGKLWNEISGAAGGNAAVNQDRNPASGEEGVTGEVQERILPDREGPPDLPATEEVRSREDDAGGDPYPQGSPHGTNDTQQFILEGEPDPDNAG